MVVPVFEAREHVRACLDSVLRHARGDFRLVIVDDASRDETLVADLDRRGAADPRVVLLRNETNGGFVVSANRGLRGAEGRDVVLLNSDTVVTRSFLEKLRSCAYADAETGIVSPLTNNGTVCSVPRFMEDNPIPFSLTPDEFAVLVERASQRRWPELVTAVGFCMFVRHEVIERVGLLDEDRFPRGYGEENDYCERAKAAGFRVRLCDDLFVAHAGRASFGGETEQRQDAHNDVIGELYPKYHQEVQHFIRTNPLAAVHEDLGRELEAWERAGALRRRLRLRGWKHV